MRTISSSFTQRLAAVVLVLSVIGCGGSNPAPNVVNNNGNTYVASRALRFISAPTRAVVDTAFDPVVKLGLYGADGALETSFQGKVRVSLGGNASLADLAGTLTVDAVDGVATFADLKVNRAAYGYTLRATAEGVDSAESLAFTVTNADGTVEQPSTVRRLRFTSLPERVAADETFDPVVKVTCVDAKGQLDATFTGAVRVALGGNATLTDLEGTLTATAVAGVATFADLKLSHAAPGYTLRAVSDDVEPVESLPFTVTGEPPVVIPSTDSKLLFTSVPVRATAGEAFSPVKAALFDGQGKIDTTFNGTVRLSLGGNATVTELDGTLSATAVNGVATFSDLKVTLAAPGYTLRAATDGVPATESLAFSVVAATPASATFISQPGNAVAGGLFDPPVRIALFDTYGNAATNAVAPVSIELQSAGVAVPDRLQGATSVSPALGEVLFAGISPTLAGVNFRLAVTLGGSTTLSQKFNVTPGVATQLSFQTQPGNAVAGSGFSPPVVVQTQDAFGNLATSSSVNIVVTAIDQAGAFAYNVNTYTSSGGTIEIYGGAMTVAATNLRLKAVAGTTEAISTATFNVVPNAPTTMKWVNNTSDIVAGALFAQPITLSISDNYGNAVPDATNVVTLTLVRASFSTSQPGLVGTSSGAMVGGVISFPTLNVTKAASGASPYYELLATSPNISSKRSNAFNVLPAPASTLAITVQPASRALGYALAPSIEVTATDPYGNTPNDGLSITAALQSNAAGATLGGTLTRATVSGKATFNDLSLDKAGTGYTLSFTAGSIPSVTSPAFDVAALAARTSLGVAPNHSCGVRPDLSIACWGQNFSGQLGPGSSTTSTPIVATELGAWSAVYAGNTVVCGSKPDKSLWCRGANTGGMLGDGTFTNRTTLTREVSNSAWKTVAIGNNHVCGIKTDDSLWCWGTGGSGQRGDGLSGVVNDSSVPAREQSNSSWQTVSAGTNYTCGIQTDGSLWCWGANAAGQLGDGTTTLRNVPTRESSNSTWTAVASGVNHTCGIKTDGSLWCWGKNDLYGILGDGTTNNSTTPVRESSLSTWAAVTVGNMHTCALKPNGSLWCWGYGGYGALGNASTGVVNKNPGQEVTSSTWTAVGAGDQHTCALKADRTIWCWGYGTEGQIGVTSSSSSTPVRERSNSTWGP